MHNDNDNSKTRCWSCQILIYYSSILGQRRRVLLLFGSKFSIAFNKQITTKVELKKNVKHNTEQLKLQVWLLLHNISHVWWYLTWAKLHEKQKVKHVIHIPTIFTIINTTNSNLKNWPSNFLFSTLVSPNKLSYHLQLHLQPAISQIQPVHL